MNSNYGVNQEFWRVEKFSLILIVFGLFLSGILYASLIMGVAGLLYVIKFSRLKHSLDGEHFLLMLSFATIMIIGLFTHHESFYWSAYLCLTPLFLYQLGRYFMSHWKSEDNLFLLLLLLAISLGAAHIGITVDDIIHNGIINPERQLGIGVDDESQRAVTQRATELSLCFFGFSVLFYKPINSFQRIAKIFFVITGILALLCGLHYVSRTCVFLFLIALLTGAVLTSKEKKNGFLSTIFFVLIFLLFLWVFGGSDTVSQLIHLYQDRGMESESIVSAGGRSELWTQAISEIFKNPFGSNVDFFAHNLWLDVGLRFGVIPFVLLIWFSASSFRKAIRIVRRKQESFLVRLCVCSFSVLFFMSCFTEPIHVSSPNYLFVYMMFCGMVNSIYHG